jgi:hypothetical protein
VPSPPPTCWRCFSTYIIIVFIFAAAIVYFVTSETHAKDEHDEWGDGVYAVFDESAPAPGLGCPGTMRLSALMIQTVFLLIVSALAYRLLIYLRHGRRSDVVQNVMLESTQHATKHIVGQGIAMAVRAEW